MRHWYSLIGIGAFLIGRTVMAHEGALPHVHVGEGVATIDVLFGAALVLGLAGIWVARRAATRQH
jgi:hypothetical protein